MCSTTGHIERQGFLSRPPDSVLVHVHPRPAALYSGSHGTAMQYAAEKRNLTQSIAELREIADGRNDILAEAAGITAGSWYASQPLTSVMS